MNTACSNVQAPGVIVGDLMFPVRSQADSCSITPSQIQICGPIVRLLRLWESSAHLLLVNVAGVGKNRQIIMILLIISMLWRVNEFDWMQCVQMFSQQEWVG